MRDIAITGESLQIHLPVRFNFTFKQFNEISLDWVEELLQFIEIHLNSLKSKHIPLYIVGE